MILRLLNNLILCLTMLLLSWSKNLNWCNQRILSVYWSLIVDMRSVISLTVSSIELVPFTYWQGEIEAPHADVFMASSWMSVRLGGFSDLSVLSPRQLISEHLSGKITITIVEVLILFEIWITVPSNLTVLHTSVNRFFWNHLWVDLGVG